MKLCYRRVIAGPVVSGAGKRASWLLHRQCLVMSTLKNSNTVSG